MIHIIIILNKSISEVDQVKLVGKKINEKLLDMIGMVYSPEIILESGLNDDINSLSRYLFMKPSKQNDINSLGLGHLNMIYMALKIVEYEVNRTRELINIMIIEEPEAHIHTHIQRTLFDKLKVTKDDGGEIHRQAPWSPCDVHAEAEGWCQRLRHAY